MQAKMQQRRPFAGQQQHHTASRPKLRPIAAAAPTAPAQCKQQASVYSTCQFHQDAWKQVRSQEQFFGIVQALVKSGKMNEKLLPLWLDFYQNYSGAVLGSKQPAASPEFVAQVQASIADNVTLQFMQPYTFPSFHERMLEPYNYYEFGQRYTGSLIDFENSVLGNADRWDQIAAMLAQKNNVILLANHQTEADPGVFAHMLASSHPNLATDVVYVAGDRVVTDPMCKPFSMGRNLFCVHSKKHINDVPELKAAKSETNRKTLVSMQRKLNEGGQLIWIAPSGGRDRPKDGVWLPDSFDPTAVDLMRNLAARAKQPTHLMPMAMYSFPLMPPPDKVEKGLGERRLTNYTGVGISVCAALDPIAIIDGIADKEAQQQALAVAAHAAATEEYKVLEKAIKDPAFRAANKQFSQPWLAA